MRDFFPIRFKPGYFVLIFVAACFLFTCDKPTEPPKLELISADIGPEGGIIVVPDDRGIYSGITLEIPAGAVAGNIRFTIYKHTASLPEYLKKVGPMVLIDAGEAEFSLPVKLTFPYNRTEVTDSNLVSILRYEPLPDQWHPLTPLGVDETTVSAMASRFSALTVSEIIVMPEPAPIGFLPSKHGFSIRNFDPPGNAGGCCNGMSAFAAWFWINNGESASSLRSHYDSCLQTQIAVEAQYHSSEIVFIVSPEIIAHDLLYMLSFGEPQTLIMKNSTTNIGHAVLIYGAREIDNNGILFKAYDPNIPKSDDVDIFYDASINNFESYNNLDIFRWQNMYDNLPSKIARRIGNLQMVPYLSNGPKTEEIVGRRPPLTLEVTSDERILDENSVRYHFEGEQLGAEEFNLNYEGKRLSATYVPDFNLEYRKTYQLAIFAEDTLGIEMCDTLWNVVTPGPGPLESWDIRLPYCSTWCDETVCSFDIICECNYGNSFNAMENVQKGVFDLERIDDTLYEFTLSDDPYIETLTAVIKDNSARISHIIEEEYDDGWLYSEHWLMEGTIHNDTIVGSYTLDAIYRLFGALCDLGYTEEDICQGSGTFRIIRSVDK